ncbi:MAG: DUF6282 family protein [Patescibacteria group bacterium]
MKKEKIYKEIIKKALDLHVHVGPEVLPRKYTAEALVAAEKGRLGGACLKSHFFPTTPFIKELKSLPKNLRLIGSITLNNSVGGLNPEAVKSAAALSEGPIMVWFPTISAKNFLAKSEYEIRPEWVKGTNYQPRRSAEINGISILKNGKLTERTKAILRVIKKQDLILATGHVSWKEARELIIKANKMNIRRMVVTHPIYELIDMSTEIQAELAGLGAVIEMCYSMFSIDKIGIEKIVSQIKTVGPENFILSSDVGQIASDSPSLSLEKFMKLLSAKGISESDLYRMMVTNPARLIGT